MSDEQEPRKKQTFAVENPRLSRKREGGLSMPVVSYESEDVPEKGDTLKITLDNGSKYTGKVQAASKSAGLVFVEFSGGLKSV